MKITFPHLGNVYIAGKAFLEEFGHEVIPPPVCSSKTLEIGSKYSPESMCLPFKIFMGNYIESIERGADTILLTGSCGPCRFGMYPLMQKHILEEAGYKVDFIVLDSIRENFSDFRKNIKKLLGTASSFTFIRSARMALELIKKADELSEKSNYIRAYSINKNEVDKIMDDYYIKAIQIHGAAQLKSLISQTELKLNKVGLHKNTDPVKIGIIGEIYTIIEPFVNLNIERKLGELGVLTDKSLTPAKWLEHHVMSYPKGSKYENEKYKYARPYMADMVGGHGRETIGSAIYYKNMGYDGVIQILPLNCMPEIVAKSVLKTVQNDMDFPIMTLVVDEMTGEAGFNTRLEAFIDLVERRKGCKIG